MINLHVVEYANGAQVTFKKNSNTYHTKTLYDTQDTNDYVAWVTSLYAIIGLPVEVTREIA